MRIPFPPISGSVNYIIKIFQQNIQILNKANLETWIVRETWKTGETRIGYPDNHSYTWKTGEAPLKCFSK